MLPKKKISLREQKLLKSSLKILEEDFSKKSSTSTTFVDFWRKSLEKGGVFDAAQMGDLIIRLVPLH